VDRVLTAGMLAAIAAGTIRPAYLIEIETATGTDNIWTGTGSLSWDSKTWLGLGEIIGISEIPETSGINAVGITITLSGVDPTSLTEAVDDIVPFKPVKMWLALFDANYAIVVDPYLAFSGRTDSVKIVESGKGTTVAVNCENRLIELNRTRERRFTQEDQILEYPDDKGFEFVNAIQGLYMPWGEAAPPNFRGIS